MISKLAYGKTGHKIELPDSYNVDIIEPLWVEGVKDQSYAVTMALRDPHSSKPLRDRVNSNEKVAIIFSDITRATPYKVIIPSLLEELQHLPKKNIRFFCANGTHRFATDQELINILGENIVKNFEIVQNDANRKEFFKYVGTTKSGNEVLLNKEILTCDVKILTGFIEPHFFAGFSGGGKALMPGMAYAETIKYNHSIYHLSMENVKWGVTNGNPLWEELMEAAEFVPGLFLLNITLNKKKEITGVFAGDMRSAHREGCKFAKGSAMVSVDKLYDIVITSNSGYPLDLNIYQTVKGMSAAAQVVKTGGNIIMAAECWDGIPSGSDYESILKSVSSINDLMTFIKEKEKSIKDTWQIYFQAQIQKKANVFLYSDKLDEETIKMTLLNPVKDISVLVRNLVDKIGVKTDICILPEGPQTIPYFESPH
jgi:nickel-dependent lactate racemase